MKFGLRSDSVTEDVECKYLIQNWRLRKKKKI